MSKIFFEIQKQITNDKRNVHRMYLLVFYTRHLKYIDFLSYLYFINLDIKNF